ncbi:hypothetical protein MNBD_GAMMA15-1113 [hydrothermal vent metagenome]|uniref:Methyltransferase domain-containing protein n=1 Tax=hydrothermal vent metagenome TaxID=652676 RepID=A0A3B0YUS7_9ZZZZ
MKHAPHERTKLRGFPTTNTHNSIRIQVNESDNTVQMLARLAKEILPPLYADPAHYDLLAQMTAPDDVPFYCALLKDRPGPVLELGCGTGRVLLELARTGVEAVGIDLSAAMIERARERAIAENLNITLALADLRNFDLGQTFELVLMPFNVLNHLLDDDSLQRTFNTIARHMTPESRLVVDTFQPSPDFLTNEPEKRRKILRYLDPYSQKEVELFEENHYEPAAQLNRIVWSYTIDGVEDARLDELTMRLFHPREIDAWLERSGFRIENKFGDYDGRPFDARSPKQLMICRLSDSGVQ